MATGQEEEAWRNLWLDIVSGDLPKAVQWEGQEPVMISHPPATTASQFKDPHLMVNLVALPNVQPWTWCTEEEEEEEEEEVDCCFCIISICHFLEIYLQRTDIFVCYT